MMTDELVLNGKLAAGTSRTLSDAAHVALAKSRRASFRDHRMTIGIVVCVALAMASASAATVTLKSNSMDGFVKGTSWSDGNVPSAGNDYLVENGYYLHGDFSQAFAGDSLQFGVVGGKQGIFFKEHAGTHTFTRLVLANGYYRIWMSSASDIAHIAGSCVVTSPSTAPFAIHSTHNGGSTGYTTYWDAALSGEEGTGLKIGPHTGAPLANARLHLSGDNSAYRGSFALYGANASTTIHSASSLGGALAAMKDDALTLEDNTILAAGDSITLAGALNRGITVKASGGRIEVPTGKTLSIAWPIGGTGTLTKQGAGTLTLACKMDEAGSTAEAKIAVAAGTLMLGDGFSAGSANAITVSAGATFAVAPGVEARVCALDVSNAGITVAYDNALKTNGIVVVADAAVLAQAPFVIYPPTNRVVTLPFMKVPTALGTITAASFKLPDNLAETGLPSATFEVKTVGDVQIAYLTTLPLVYVRDKHPTTGAANANAYLRYGSDAWKWSDDKVPHKGADYEVGYGRRLDWTGIGSEETLACNTLSFRGTSTSSRAILGTPNDVPFTVNKLTGDIRAYAYTQFYMAPKSGSEVHLCGKLYVCNNLWSDLGLDMRMGVNVSGTTCIDSAVSGSGYLSMQSMNDSKTNVFYFTSAANTFAGTYFVYNSRPTSKVVIKFANAASFGCPPETAGTSLHLQGYTEFYPEGSQTYDFPNRKFAFWAGGNHAVRVDEGETFTLNAPILFQATSVAEKVGGGIWAVGDAASIDGTGTPTLTISEGYLRADNARAFVNVSLAIGAAGGLAAHYVPGSTAEAATYGLVVTDAAKFAVKGDTLRVRVTTDGADMRKVTVPFLTVPASLASMIDAKTISVSEDAEGFVAQPVREAVTLGGVSCVRYSCKFMRHRGLVLMIQ